RRFLEKIYVLASQKEFAKTKNAQLTASINKSVKKVSEDIEVMKFNTAISSLMILVNSFYEAPENITKENIKSLLMMVSPFAPHLAEELWGKVGGKGLCSQQKWPEYDEKLNAEEKVWLIVQVNGKVRDRVELAGGISQQEAEKLILSMPKVKQWTEGKEIKKIIFVSNKLINIVI
ncbi:MAG: leucine--tRNA ligase, partial [Candidatus Staskawiczbacteria bacterium]|nr:leucine--tRNA ligase [Candidatus Staskawiczbacteria bacterium]